MRYVLCFALCFFTLTFILKAADNTGHTVASNSVASLSEVLAAMDEVQGNGRISVFLDSPWWADDDFIRLEIPLVNYVRDKELADVHLMLERHGGGRAGTTYEMTFIGQRGFSGMHNRLTYWAPSTNTADANRRGYTRVIKLGLTAYIARSTMAEHVHVHFDYQPQMAAAREKPLEDPWKHWIFEIYGGGNFNKEETSSAMNLRYGVIAEKVTHEWKLFGQSYFNYSEREFITGEDVITRYSHRNGFNGRIVKSLDSHWSAGLFTSMLASTFHNMRFNWELKPAIEYSLFPYTEATRRSISFVYRIGGGYHNYREETIFEKNEEILLGHSIEASARFQQPWGHVRAGMSGSHYFHDFDVNRATFFTNLNLRVFQGFSISLSGNLDLINDLVSVPKGDLSLEDVLLQQRRQSTSYYVSGSIGLSYTFGSDFTGVYNPRL